MPITLKEKSNEHLFENYCYGEPMFDLSKDKVKAFITQALQEQDRESKRQVIKAIMTFGLSEEFLIEDYAKQHNIDLYEN